MRLGFHGLQLAVGVAALVLAARPGAAQDASSVPAWLQAHIGEGNGQIAPPVLWRGPGRSIFAR